MASGLNVVGTGLWPRAILRLAILSALAAAGQNIVRADDLPDPLRVYEATEARQGVAIDARHFYAIGNREIGKYERKSGRRVARWEGAADGPIHHLNGGVVFDGKLYCAHSNYPAMPMTSSVEVWDTSSLEHVASHSFSIYTGSLTWVDRHDGNWWAGFAVYSGDKAPPGKDNRWTQVIQFDASWRRRQAWVFPTKVLEKFHPMSNSGASWGPDGLLYATGHDHHEVYVLRLPMAGSTLELVETVPVANFGQGVAWDRTPGAEPQLWGIIKAQKKVVVTGMPHVEHSGERTAPREGKNIADGVLPD